MKKVFLKDAAAVFTLSSGKKAGLMLDFNLMVEDKPKKALRLATEEEVAELNVLMDEDIRRWQQVELECL